MAQDIQGNVTGKIRFNIDKKSWDNLALFQKKLTSIKRQMSGLKGTIKVNAIVNDIKKVTRAVDPPRIEDSLSQVSIPIECILFQCDAELLTCQVMILCPRFRAVLFGCRHFHDLLSITKPLANELIRLQMITLIFLQELNNS